MSDGLISRTVVQRPRKARRCANHIDKESGLYCYFLIPAGTPQVRLYGAAEPGDPPYVLWLCVDCDPKKGANEVTKEERAPKSKTKRYDRWHWECPACDATGPDEFYHSNAQIGATEHHDKQHGDDFVQMRVRRTR